MRTYITAAAVLALSSGAALANYSDSGITMIVAWAAGGGTDAIARTVAAGGDLALASCPGREGRYAPGLAALGT